MTIVKWMLQRSDVSQCLLLEEFGYGTGARTPRSVSVVVQGGEVERSHDDMCFVQETSESIESDEFS